MVGCMYSIVQWNLIISITNDQEEKGLSVVCCVLTDLPEWKKIYIEERLKVNQKIVCQKMCLKRFGNQWFSFFVFSPSAHRAINNLQRSQENVRTFKSILFAIYKQVIIYHAVLYVFSSHRLDSRTSFFRSSLHLVYKNVFVRMTRLRIY